DGYRTPSLPDYLLVSSSILLDLFLRCPACGTGSIVSMTSHLNGSALTLKWECEMCQEQSWSSQPRLSGRYWERNAKFVSAAHTTGLPLARVADFADVMGLAVPAQRTVHDLLVNLVLPSVDHVYVNHMRDVGRGVDVSIDGRYDSPGFCATNCTVSVIDLKTNLIMMVVNMHKRMRGIEGKSGRMEKEGVREGLKRIIALVYKIRSVCSDNDAKIGKMLREDVHFKDIKHLLDFWHLIKGINHDLRELAKKKSCPNI
ncbi:hypothetical protein PENTCL1PPCAC_19760, partial [Pristionchus entomophagus]